MISNEIYRKIKREERELLVLDLEPIDPDLLTTIAPIRMERLTNGN